MGELDAEVRDDKAATLQIIEGPNACRNEYLEI